MKPTSKIINTFLNKEKSGYTYLIAHCEDGSIWKAMYLMEEYSYNIGLKDWKCIFEAPESETKKMVENFLIDDLSKISYYNQNGWQLVSTFQESRDILVKKDFEKYLTRREMEIISQKATLYYEDCCRNNCTLFWKEVNEKAKAEFLSEQEELLTPKN